MNANNEMKLCSSHIRHKKKSASYLVSNEQNHLPHGSKTKLIIIVKRKGAQQLFAKCNEVIWMSSTEWSELIAWIWTTKFPNLDYGFVHHLPYTQIISNKARKKKQRKETKVWARAQDITSKVICCWLANFFENYQIFLTDWLWWLMCRFFPCSIFKKILHEKCDSDWRKSAKLDKQIAMSTF